MVIETPSDDGMTFTTSPSKPGFQYRTSVKYVLPKDLGRLELKGKPTTGNASRGRAIDPSIVIMSEGTKSTRPLRSTRISAAIRSRAKDQEVSRCKA
jgi:hypothetical protein